MAQVQRFGPYGNDKAKENYSFQIKDDETITEVIVRSGFMVDAIGFTITGDDGVSSTSMYGGKGGNENKIKLQLGENIIGISGRSKGSKMSQLRIHTDLVPRGHGPYGDDELKGGSDFQSPMPLCDNQEVIGFFGSAQDSVASIGLYATMQSETIVKAGPFGYQTGQQWSIMLEPCENLKEIIVKTGAIVDSFTFVTTKSRRKFGGDGGNTEDKITLQSGEFITNVSGWIGEWQTNRCLTKLKLHTNFRVDGYGPFGGGPYTNYLSEFRSQVPSGGRVVGFFGTLHKNYVESIGLYVKQ